jgi:hypothetical protein
VLWLRNGARTRWEDNTGMSGSVLAWLEGLEEKFVAVRVRVGKSSSNPASIGVVAFGELGRELGDKMRAYAVSHVETREDWLDAILQMATDAGWPEEFAALRLHAYDADGKEGKSKTETDKSRATGKDHAEGMAIMQLTNALVSQSRVQTGVIKTLSEHIEHRESLLAEALETMMTAREAQIDAEAESLATQLIADAELIEESDPFREAAARTLESVGAMLAGSIESPDLDADGILALLEARPDLAKECATDPRIVARIMASVTPEPAPAEDAPK